MTRRLVVLLISRLMELKRDGNQVVRASQTQLLRQAVSGSVSFAKTKNLRQRGKVREKNGN